MNKLSTTSRILTAIASLSLVATYFLPIWFIFLIAPQYPEGLTMTIWLDKISGEVEIINGLNHYIGMKHIKTEMFPEFEYLVYVVAVFIALGLFVAISGNRKMLLGLITLSILGGILAMYDFYQWGYDYGHNLDPKAAIQIPGLSYQPPLIGHKTLLNFDAYSYPDIGGWVVIGAAVIFVFVYILEWRRSRKTETSGKRVSRLGVPAAAAILVFGFASCSSGPEQFKYGSDICDDCNMTIMDPNYGGQIITTKGKVYKFDDVHCLANFLNKKKVAADNISQLVFVDYGHKNHLVPEKDVWFVVSPELKSPMNSHAAALSDSAAAIKLATEKAGKVKNWKELYPTIQ